MHVHLTPDGVGPAWPPLPFEAEASVGVTSGGPAQLLDVLETALGLGGKRLDPALRASRLLAAVRRADAFFSASAAVDPLGVAQTLLRWRDALRLEGWRGEPVSPRLRQLAEVTADAAPGLPERIEAVLAALDGRPPPIERVTIYEAVETLPRLWRTLLERLGRSGVRVEPAPAVVAEASGDLGALARAVTTGARVDRVGDGSIGLVRPAAPRRAAEEIAAWLAARDDWSETLVIGGDAVLDHALRRHGLPTLGATELHDDAIVAALRLSLALGWSRRDPERALDLCMVRGGPIPSSIARRLIDALHAWPAIGSDAWDTALAEGLAEIEDATRRGRVAKRLRVLFEHAATTHYPRALAVRKTTAFLTWCRGMLVRPDVSSPRDYEAAAAVGEAFLELLAAFDREHIEAPQLHRLLELAGRAAASAPVWQARAGLRSVEQPGAMLGPARRVIWWSFRREAVPSTQREVPLDARELAALQALGVSPRSPSERARLEALRWRRPLLATQQTLVCVCPERGEDGEAIHPHPLWDEISTGLSETMRARLELRRLAAEDPVVLVAREPLGLPSPRRHWTVPAGRVGRRERGDSPSSLEKLLGCPLRYVLDYVAHVRRGRVAGLPGGPLLSGNVAHRIIGETLAAAASGASAPGELAAAAAARFDEAGPRLAATLFRPGFDAERAALRAAIERSVEIIAELLEEAGLCVLATEREATGRIAEGDLGGTADLVVGTQPGGSPTAIVDLKWGRERDRRYELEAGIAVQLAAYALLFGTGAHIPDIAYFILRTTHLVARADGVFPGGDVRGPQPQVVIEALEASAREAFAALASGTIVAAGNGAPNEVVTRSNRTGDRLRLVPPCHYCDHAALCGKTYGGAS